MELDPTQRRELEFLESHQSIHPLTRLTATVLVSFTSLVAAGGAGVVAASEHERWLPWSVAFGLAGLFLSALVAVFKPSMSNETLIRWTVPSDKAAREGGRAVQRDGVRNRPPGEPPTRKYWDAWK